MSAEPTIFSSFRLSVTVEWALMASTITTTPKAIRIAPETKPPIRRAFVISVPHFSCFMDKFRVGKPVQGLPT